VLISFVPQQKQLPLRRMMSQTRNLFCTSHLSPLLSPNPSLQPRESLCDIKHSFCMQQLLEQFAEQTVTYVACQMQDSLSQLLCGDGRECRLHSSSCSSSCSFSRLVRWQWQPNSFRWH